MLFQRRNRLQGLLLLRKQPVFRQFSSMTCRPFEHEGQYARREIAFQNRKGIDTNLSLAVAINRMKVRRGMIVIKHSYDDSKKSG